MLKHLTRILAAVLLCGAVAALPARAADLQKILSSGTVRIGVPIDVPPFGSVDAKNEPVGLDVDMAKKIAEALGVKLELQQITGANRVPYLVTDRLDIVIAAMGATPERALQIAFTSPYAALSIGVFGPDSIAVKSPADLKDETIAVARGTTQDLELTKAAPNAKIVRFDDDATAAVLDQIGRNGADGVACAIEIDVDLVVPVIVCHFKDRLEGLDSGIRKQDIDLAEGFGRPRRGFA